MAYCKTVTSLTQSTHFKLYAFGLLDLDILLSILGTCENPLWTGDALIFIFFRSLILHNPGSRAQAQPIFYNMPLAILNSVKCIYPFFFISREETTTAARQESSNLHSFGSFSVLWGQFLKK